MSERYKYRFEIIYQPPSIKKTCELMQKLDLLSKNSEIGITDKIEFLSSSKDALKVKSNLIKAFEEAEYIVLSCEGGIIV